MDPSFLEAAKFISNEYRDLNGTGIEILDHPPSAIEFSRVIHISRPTIIKGFRFPALDLWTDEYLTKKMKENPISIATTPNGLADSICRASDGRLYFVEPFIEKMTMQQLLFKLGSKTTSPKPEIYYLQSQNGNLFSSSSFDSESNEATDNNSEFFPLLSDVPKEVPWCSEALGQHPDAVNLWIGNEQSITSIHSDPYENIYTVVRGEKHFVLLPPSDSWCLKERYYPHATYTRTSSSEALEILPSTEDIPQVRWSSILDPDSPNAFPSEITPIRVTLKAGESLYLPVGWWHYVRQSGLTIALNWWYDAEMRGMSWTLLNFLRNSTTIHDGNYNDNTD
ncbi:Bifunctional peptidase and (3S)-lysyl hydroxylase Jmjd7 [Psilocybe cubensis]|uniref:JmjC domain-containing protein n=2 Tax=Psilocybe cubensis TaxID=181762 RepID=A0A8H7Y155_PSICU|nr:Bifunctional peptidase and (3S)-lysyl hydroxylase Jmjd7 [Psilocybe cubensis]KAH9482667.1 Bifunctional peptidase and (3S)-lysyl hydroxylase Jmjd7 [Psilocybe cubensis]